MSKLSLDKFLLLLEGSNLVEPDRLAPTVDGWKRQASLTQLDDASDCAQHLVDAGLLTPWQCHKLLDGRYRGFFLGQYKLLDHLSSGGMSTVYLAEHVLMQRRVAIKVLPHDRIDDPEYLARFQVEAQAAASLDHRNIVRAYDVGVDGKVHFLVMEFIAGRDLNAIVTQDGPLEVHLAAHYVAQAAAGLEHAHRRGLVHRDVKPANLLVDGDGTVKILDMGLAQFTSGAAHCLPAEEHVVGTADFLAPEQAAAQSLDARADIYALGCTLYFLLTGHPPFARGTVLARMAAHQRQIAPSILLDRRDAPRPLVSICRRMMEKLPDDRYPSAAAVQKALADWLAQEAAAGRTCVSAGRAAGLPCNRPSVAGESGLGLSTSLTDTADPRPTDSSLSETDPNLNRATVKLPSRASGLSASEQQSPPRSSAPGPDTKRTGRRESSDPTGFSPIARHDATAAERADESCDREPSRGARWPWVLLALALVISALSVAWWALSL